MPIQEFNQSSQDWPVQLHKVIFYFDYHILAACVADWFERIPPYLEDPGSIHGVLVRRHLFFQSKFLKLLINLCLLDVKIEYWYQSSLIWLELIKSNLTLAWKFSVKPDLIPATQAFSNSSQTTAWLEFCGALTTAFGSKFEMRNLVGDLLMKEYLVRSIEEFSKLRKPVLPRQQSQWRACLKYISGEVNFYNK